MISIKGINKAELLAALVNAAEPKGLGFLQSGDKPMTKEEAQKRIDTDQSTDLTFGMPGEHLCFDYVKGRPIKSDLSGDELNPALYDRDHGQGAAARAIDQLRNK